MAPPSPGACQRACHDLKDSPLTPRKAPLIKIGFLITCESHPRGMGQILGQRTTVVVIPMVDDATQAQCCTPVIYLRLNVKKGLSAIVHFSLLCSLSVTPPSLIGCLPACRAQLLSSRVAGLGEMFLAALHLSDYVITKIVLSALILLLLIQGSCRNVFAVIPYSRTTTYRPSSSLISRPITASHTLFSDISTHF